MAETCGTKGGAVSEGQGKKTIQIRLTQGKFSTIDIEDYNLISRWKWRVSYCKKFNLCYAERSFILEGKKYRIKMHRQIMDFPVGKGIDHKDRNGLNNSRSNLRVASQAQNNCNKGKRRDNTSGFKGVSRAYNCNRWKAQIQVSKKIICLGNFRTKEEAANAYDLAARKYHGEFVVTNA